MMLYASVHGQRTEMWALLLTLIVVSYTPTVRGQAVDVSTCGDTKSCFLNPDGCSGSACEFIVTWSAQSSGGSVDFEVEAAAASDVQYVAIGFSKDERMGDDSVIDCLNLAASSAVVRASYNTGKSNSPLSNPNVGIDQDSIEGQYEDGRIRCRFSRKITVDNVPAADQSKVFNLDQDYYLLVARGSIDAGSKQYHSTRLASADQFAFASSDAVEGGGEAGPPALIKVHAIVMMLAWMLCSSFAVLMPRYNKKSWPDKKLCGKAVWFIIHISLMSSTLILTTLGFIAIFVYVGGYSQLAGLPDQAHPVLGIISTCLLVLNVIMGAARPPPGTSTRRKIFNICHLTVGLLAFVTAVAAIFIAMYISQAEAPEWGVWIMVAFICWQFVVEMSLLTYDRILMRKSRSSSSKESDPSGLQIEDPNQPQDSGSGVKTFILAFHLMGVLGLTLSLCVSIGLA